MKRSETGYSILYYILYSTIIICSIVSHFFHFQCIALQGLVRQKLEGTGTAFLGATGTIVQKVLDAGEVMLIDTNCLLAYAETAEFDLKRTGGIVNWIGGGEGIFNSSITGPGLVVVQSMNMCVLLQSLAADKIYRR